jgi:DNA-binding XRE family transcriptional regulator
MGLTQGDLAAEIGVTRQTVSNIERTGRHDSGSVAKLARFFGVSIATMYEVDAETADMQFLGAQIDRLSESALEKLQRFSRALTDRADDDRIRPKRR